MEQGYVKLYRRLLDSRVFQNEGLLKVWVWCLLKVNHKSAWVTVKVGRTFTEVQVLPGQFIFGRKAAAKDLKMSPSTVWKRIKKLEDMQNLNTDSNTNYTIISVLNWDSYQGSEKKGDSKGDHRVTTGKPPGDTDKNDKNVKYKKYSRNSIEFRLSELLLNLILERRNSFKKPDLQKWARHVDLMLKTDKRNSDEIEEIIKWCQQESFWQKNILSTAKLRKHFDQLAMKMGPWKKTEEARPPYYGELSI